MLIELRFKNFLSFKEETVFSMTNVISFKEHLEENIISTEREFDLLKSAAIYGANASGKSNFMKVIIAMGNILFNSFSNSLKKEEEKPKADYQFKLNSECETENTRYEVSFLLDDCIYKYGFEINGYDIKKEWLSRKKDREVYLFKRKNDKYDINNESFKEGNKFKSEVNPNVLFLSHLAQNNQKISRKIFGWFLNVDTISGLYEGYYDKFTAKLLEKDSTFKKWVASVLKYLEISNIEASEKGGEILTYHNKFDNNNLLIDAIPFKIHNESEGTTKLIHILGPIYDTLRNGKILFIDEFDSKLHPNLSKKLIDLFHKHNKKNAQIIISGQDTNLLDKNIYRRDQIWFVEKDQFGASELYSLSDFDSKTVRNDSAFDKKYLNHIFGAAETLEISDDLVNLLYESQKK